MCIRDSLRGADAIVLSSYVSESPDAPSFDAALFAFDAQTGEKIYEHRFEPASLYPVWTDVAGDGESMAFYYLYDENGENCTQVILINEDVLRNGVRFAAYDFSQVTFQYMAQLHDSAFLIATKENEIAVLDAKTMKSVSYTHLPILGDRRYGYNDERDLVVPTLALHACGLVFPHPVQKRTLAFYADPSINPSFAEEDVEAFNVYLKSLLDDGVLESSTL